MRARRLLRLFIWFSCWAFAAVAFFFHRDLADRALSLPYWEADVLRYRADAWLVAGSVAALAPVALFVVAWLRSRPERAAVTPPTEGSGGPAIARVLKALAIIILALAATGGIALAVRSPATALASILGAAILSAVLWALAAIIEQLAARRD